MNKDDDLKALRGREDFHTLSWLQYAYLQQGKFDDAAKALATSKAVADRDHTPGVTGGGSAADEGKPSVADRLDLADWRRRISDLYAAVRAEAVTG